MSLQPDGPFTPGEPLDDEDAASRPPRTREYQAGGITLEDRVAAIERALAVPALDLPGQLTDEQVAGFREEFARLAKLPGVRWLPRAPVLTPETARALLRECVTVVQPGETLVIRAPGTWTPRHVEEYQDHADAATASGRIPFRVLVVIGDELAVIQPEPDDVLSRRIAGILPGLLAEENKKMSRVANSQVRL